MTSGCSAVGLAHMIWDHGVGGSSPSTPTIIYSFLGVFLTKMLAIYV